MPKTSIEWLRDERLKDCRTSGATMGTRYTARFVVSRHAQVQAIVADLESAVTAVDMQMSNWKPGSDLSRLNRAAPDTWIPVPANLASVLARAIEIGRETCNAFNIGVGELVDTWGFGPAGGRGPRGASAGPHACRPVDELLEVDVPGRRARKHARVALDLCGIAKGFGVDELARVLDRHDVGSWLVGIDGEMRARGCRPDGSPWAIALEAPEDGRRAAMGVIELGDAAIATSGDYRHWIEIGGARISHTMDPRTGAPLQGDVASVTVIAQTCADADAYATALMVLGAEAGRGHARRRGLDALFVARKDGELRTTGTGVFGDA
ncbi:FAD:protein FMN transferase [Variovorax sp. RA8]|uniref:FAD:protein FMN transferase n=1 Tax=Variovorax sp. (strain JCM 16519 / RA8) TaxID=662548 RepID=UPI001318B90D|nr:FAD:protein FMN transferase [Variovorax sp. RA8]VTU38428.1 Thiamine biosynthesis lipoprotein ApbE precursor [Variovorax sp. RA8]